MKNPHVSIIVPIFNVEELVIGCLTSIQKQTFTDFEVLCIDDGSTDKSGILAEQFAEKDNRFRVVHQENKGLSGARNTGIKVAKGAYIYFVDSDDYIHPRALEILCDVMQKYPSDVVGGGFVKTSDVYGGHFPEIKEEDLRVTVYDNPFQAFLRRRDIMTGVWTRLYSRQIFDSVRFVEGIYFEDVPFTTTVMATIGRMAVVKAPLYYYYQNPSSIMRTSFNIKKVASYVTVIQTVYDTISRIRPQDINQVRRCILNQRFKMMINQAVRKQKDKQVRRVLFDEIHKQVIPLYQSGRISFEGLKIKHRIALFLLLHNQVRAARVWMGLF